MRKIQTLSLYFTGTCFTFSLEPCAHTCTHTCYLLGLNTVLDLAPQFKIKMYVGFEVHVGTSDGKEGRAQLLLSQRRLWGSRAACRASNALSRVEELGLH